MNSTSTMPPRSCLMSNSPLVFGWPSSIFERMVVTSSRSCAGSHGIRRISTRNASKRCPDVASPATKRARREGLMLEHPGLGALIRLECVQPTDQQAGRAIRPQPQIGLVQDAGGGEAGQPGVDALSQARVVLCGVRVLVVVQEDQIEVRGVAQLLSAQLAVADDGEARRARGGACAVRPTQAATPRAESGRRDRSSDRSASPAAACRPDPAPAGAGSALA